jgi:hypothetical protein
MVEGSGSGSRRPKNMWIRWIQIQIQNRNPALRKSRIHIRLTVKRIHVKVNIRNNSWV